MSVGTARLERAEPAIALDEERLGFVRIDGARHSLIWAYDSERAVSVLIDRSDGGDRLIGSFWPEEDFDAVEALAGDYEEQYVRSPQEERIRPRSVEAADLEPALRP